MVSMTEHSVYDNIRPGTAKKQLMDYAVELEGTDIGLATVHFIINSHDRHVWVEGEVDK